MNNLKELSISNRTSLEEQKKFTREIYVATKKELEVSSSLDKVIEEEFWIKGVKTKLQVRYLVDGLTDQEYETALPTIFGELPVEDLTDAKTFESSLVNKKVLQIESIPGQYDETVAATQDCLMLQTGEKNHNVRAFATITFEGNISYANMNKIKKYLVNPVEKQSVSTKDKLLDKKIIAPENVAIVDWFTNFNDKDLKEFIKEYKLAMNLDDIKLAQEYFSQKERDPTITEMLVLDTYRSDHCRHTTFNTEIWAVEFADDANLSEDQKKILTQIKESHKLYKDTKAKWKNKDKPDTLMGLATAAGSHLTTYPDINPNIKNIVFSEENNACEFTYMVDMEDGSQEEWRILFKNETHNHPTTIEPYGGAATCLWWCIRDPLSGRARPFQAMRVTGGWDPTKPISQTIAGKLSGSVISTLAALGFSSYGNQIGLHAGEVKSYFHPRYEAKRLEVWYVVAGAPAKNHKKEKPKKWDMVLMLWGKTGRDGIGWAKWSSVSHDSGSVSNLWAEVQKGNPVEERKLERLFLDPRFSLLIKRCNDFGAGGVAVAIGELTRWLTIDLDKVQKKYAGLDGSELAISESQERMAIVISPEDYDIAQQLMEEYDVLGVEVATVEDNEEDSSADKLVMQWTGPDGERKNIVDIDRDFLDKAWAKRTIEKIKIDVKKDGKFYNRINETIEQILNDKDLKKAFLENLKQLNVASQKGEGSIFDNSVGASNVLSAFGGKYQLSPQMGMISKIPTFNWVDARTTSIGTHGFNPDLACESAYLWAYNSVKIAISKSVALWGKYDTILLSLQEYFGALRDEPERRWECYAALLGAFRAQMELAIPAIGGKDSMSGSFLLTKGKDKIIINPSTSVEDFAQTDSGQEAIRQFLLTDEGKVFNIAEDIIPHLIITKEWWVELKVPPTLIAFAQNMGAIDRVVSAEFKKPWNHIVYFPSPDDGEAYKHMLENVQDLIGQGVVHASSVVESWWIAANITKMAVGNHIGCDIQSENVKTLFQEQLWGIILEIDPSVNVQSLYPNAQLLWKTNDREQININDTDISLQEATQTWTELFEKIHPTTPGWWTVESIPVSEKANSRIELLSSAGLQKNFNIVKWIKPKVLIPVFPGTNSELDTAHAIRKAGMEPVEFIFKTQTPELLIESTKQFAKLLKDAQMVVFPWWFSAWDQPHGSAKMITSIFRMNILRDAMQQFLDNPDTLTLGICNGFQALIKLWVFDESKIIDHLTESSPTLTHNSTRRHMTDQVWLQVTSILSPMMSKVNIGDTFIIPISHGEWRLYMKDKETLERYIANGQIVLQYLDVNGNPTNQHNGSLQGIAGICSKNGRVLWLMPHPERSGAKLYKNIPGNHHLPIFESAAYEFGVKSNS
jgi:phosphoribosylformylglycinamidine synthase